jgi:hypothetical protein
MNRPKSALGRSLVVLFKLTHYRDFALIGDEGRSQKETQEERVMKSEKGEIYDPQ